MTDDSFLKSELDRLRKSGLLREPRVLQGPQGREVTIDGRRVLLFCSNNYLGLADHPALVAAAKEAADQDGCGSGAARLISGSMELHRELERKTARFMGAESALVFNSGYSANVGTIQALVGRGDAVFSDKLNHASLLDGCLLSGADLYRFPHRDLSALRKKLGGSAKARRRLIVTDGLFSMDGDLAPLREIAELADRFEANAMIDEAHAVGVLGERGRGACELADCESRFLVRMGTFGKAIGSFGAFVAGSGELVDYLMNKSRSFIYSTSLPPPVLASSIAGLEMVEREPERRKRLLQNAGFVRTRLKDLGLDVGEGEFQIIPIRVGDAKKVMQASAAFLERGIFIQGIRSPTVPEGTERLRLSLMSDHTGEDLQTLIGAVAEVKSLGLLG